MYEPDLAALLQREEGLAADGDGQQGQASGSTAEAKAKAKAKGKAKAKAKGSAETVAIEDPGGESTLLDRLRMLDDNNDVPM